MEIRLCYGCMEQKDQPGPCPRCGFDENTYEPEPHHLPPGTIVAGKYLLGRVLGEGGFGITYIGWDLNLQLRVAIKEYYPGGLVSRSAAFSTTLTVFTGQRLEYFQNGLEKFIDEARRLGKFWGMPGIVGVKDYFQENKTAYIVMEFAQGQTLKALLKTRPESRLPADQVFDMMRPVMDALEAVHGAGIIHRDVSPDNLMVDPSGMVRLLDFGAARNFLSAGEKSLSVMLKPGYAPEEQYRSRGQQGPWTDVYGLCATMYRAITGQVPEESLDRLEKDTLRWPSQLEIPINKVQEKALMIGLEVSYKKRFQNMGALKRALYESVKKDAAYQPLPSDTSAGAGQTVWNPPPVPASETGAQDTKSNSRETLLWLVPVIAVAVSGIIAAVILTQLPGKSEEKSPVAQAWSQETAGKIDAEDTWAGIGESLSEEEYEQALEERGIDRETADLSQLNVRLAHEEMESVIIDNGDGADFGICVVDALTGTMYNGDLSLDAMPADAMTDICILYTTAWLCDNDYMTLEDEVLFTYYGESQGVLSSDNDGTYFTAMELLIYMLRFGDRNAANSLMEHILIDNINYVCTEVGKYVSVDIRYLYGQGENYVCATDIAMMLYALDSDAFESIGRSFMEVCFYMEDTVVNAGMAQAIPSGYTVLNHCGAGDGVYNEALVVRSDDTYYLIVVMSRSGDPETEAAAMEKGARIAHRDLCVPLEQ